MARHQPSSDAAIALLREAARVTKKDGFVIFTTLGPTDDLVRSKETLKNSGAGAGIG
jgi:hypothetical protein